MRHANIVGVTSTDGQVMFGQGDSGGPVYKYTNSERFVTSIIQGWPRGWSVDCPANQTHYPGTQCMVEKGRVTAMSSITDALAGRNFVVRSE